jgi:hypothetical protein
MPSLVAAKQVIAGAQPSGGHTSSGGSLVVRSLSFVKAKANQAVYGDEPTSPPHKWPNKPLRRPPAGETAQDPHAPSAAP